MRKQVMGVVMALATIMPASTVTAAPKSPKLARCDGHHRRTANPYGSILPTVDPQTGASTPAGQEQGRAGVDVFPGKSPRSEEHTSEHQTIKRNSYAVLCWKKKKDKATRQ